MKNNSLWIKPPSEEISLSWQTFLAIGQKIDEAIRYNEKRLFSFDELDKLLEEMKLKEPEMNHHPEENGFLTKHFHRDANLESEIASFLNNEDAFPFLKGLSMPLSAKIIAAILASSFVESYKHDEFDKVLAVFRIMNLPPQDYESEGNRLITYTKSKESLLNSSISRESLVCSFWLNKRGYKVLLGLDLKKDFFENSEDDMSQTLRAFFRLKTQRIKKKQRRSEERIYSKVKLDDVVLEKDTRTRLDYIVKYYKIEKNTPFKLLFYGPSGTGKTYTAYALTSEVKRPVMPFDLSEVLDKYVGETEKILTKIFNEAQEERAVILLDEADSYFYKRSALNRSWENNHVNHILKLMETKNVSLILCTNFYDALDGALLRRIDEVIEFKIPSQAGREEIWKKELKKRSIYDDKISLKELSKIPISGGLISIAVKKAKKIKTIEGDTFTIDENFLQKLAMEEMKKFEKFSETKRICGFGG